MINSITTSTKPMKIIRHYNQLRINGKKQAKQKNIGRPNHKEMLNLQPEKSVRG